MMRILRTDGWLSSMMLLTPFVVFFVYFAVFHVDGPCADDFDVILGFLNTFVPGEEWSALGSIPNQHNEHRPGLARLLSWGCYMTLGEVSFAGLQCISHVALACLAVLLTLKAREEGLSRYWLVPIPSLVLACVDTSNAMITMCGICNWSVHLFAWLAFALWPRRPAVSIACGMMAAYTSAAGLLVLPVMVLFQLLMPMQDNEQKILGTSGWRFGLVALVAAMCVSWSLYYAGYAVTGQVSLPQRLLSNPGGVMMFFLELLESPLGLNTAIGGMSVTGTVVLGLALVLLGCGAWRRADVFVTLLVYELLVLFVIATARLPLEAELNDYDRYRIVSLLVWVSVYVVGARMLAGMLNEVWKERAGAAGAVIFLSVNILLAVASFRSYQMFQDLVRYQMGSDLTSSQSFLFSDPERCRRIALEADEKGIYPWRERVNR